MTRDDKIKALYCEIYHKENYSNISIKEMEESLEKYYSPLGYSINAIDDLFKSEIYKDMLF